MMRPNTLGLLSGLTLLKLDELPNGYGVKYTLGFFYAPSGKSYQGVGITPDIEVDRSSDEIMRCCATTDPVERVAKDVQLRTALAVLRP